MAQADESSGVASGANGEPARADAWAWGLCWMMFAATVLNYMDRQTVSLVRPQMREAFGITADVDFGWVLSAFAMTYALFQVPAGYLVDRWDLRWSYAGAVAWWSLAAVASALVPGLGLLITCRALLGVGESFNWPCALRVTARVLPPSDRSLGNGIFNAGAAVGAVVTPFVVTPLTLTFHWQTPFLLVGSAGFIWVAAWLFSLLGKHGEVLARRKHTASRGEFRAPGADALPEPGRPGLGAKARLAFAGVIIAAAAIALSAIWYGLVAVWLGIALAMIGPLVVAAVFPRRELEGAEWALSLQEVACRRRFVVLVLVSVSINICWHFLINWIPTYLKDERGLSYQTSNFSSALPFVAAALGNIGGGWLSQRLAARGGSAVRARKLVMGLCTLLISSGVAVGLARTNTTALVLLCLMAAGTAAFMANFFAFAQEVTTQHTGLVTGYLGALGNIFVAGFLPSAGKVKDLTGSFSLIFLLVGILPVIGMATLVAGWNEREGSAEEPTRGELAH